MSDMMSENSDVDKVLEQIEAVAAASVDVSTISQQLKSEPNTDVRRLGKPAADASRINRDYSDKIISAVDGQIFESPHPMLPKPKDAPFKIPQTTIKFSSAEVKGISIMFDDACSMKQYYTSLVLEDTAANKTYKFSGTSFPWEPLVIKGNSFIFKVDNTENLGPKDFYGWKFTVNGLDSLPDESIKVVQTRHPQRGDTKIKGEIDFPNCKGMVLNFDKECSSRKFYDKLIISPGNGDEDIVFKQDGDGWPTQPVFIPSSSIKYSWRAIGKMHGEYYGFKFTASPSS